MTRHRARAPQAVPGQRERIRVTSITTPKLGATVSLPGDRDHRPQPVAFLVTARELRALQREIRAALTELSVAEERREIERAARSFDRNRARVNAGETYAAHPPRRGTGGRR